MKKSYEVSFDSKMSLAIAKDYKVVEAFMHDERNRVTLLFNDLGAFTFQLKAKKELTNSKSKWKAEFPIDDERATPS